MSRTFGGLYFLGPTDLIALSGGVVATTQSVLTRNGAGDISWNQVATQTVVYAINLQSLKRPFITFPAPPGMGTVGTSNELKELFGTASGGPGNPFSGGQSGIQFETSAIPWGLSILDIGAVYSVGTNPLTGAGSTISLFRQTYAENAANSQSTLVNAAALTVGTTVGATTCHVFKTSLAQPLTYESTDNTDLVLECSVQTPGGGTARVYGLFVHVAVEYP